MKRFFAVLTAVIALSTCIAFGAGCDENGNPIVNRAQTSDIEITNFEYGVVPEKDYVEGMSAVDGGDDWALEVSRVYYILCDFDVSCVTDNIGQDLLTIVSIFRDINILFGSIQEVTTDSVNEVARFDDESGKDISETTMNFRIPADSSTPKHIKIILRLMPVKVGLSHVSVGWTRDERRGYNISFNINSETDGLSHAVDIIASAIEAPVLSFDESKGTVSWNHVENAEFYRLYADNSSTYFKEVPASEFIQTGQQMSLSLIGLLSTGYHTVRIQACNSSANFVWSYYSDEVEAILY